MATTARDTITSALKKLGVLRAGGSAKGGDAGDALASLSSWYQELITNGTCGVVRNVPISSSLDATTGFNQHINVLTDDEVDLKLPSTVQYEYWDTYEPCRDYGWGLNVPLGGTSGMNVPPDKSVVRITDQFGPGRATYIYDGTVQRWMRIDALTLDDEAPLSARGPDGLASVLAVRLVDEYGDALLSPATIQSANKYRLALVQNYNGGDCGW